MRTPWPTGTRSSGSWPVAEVGERVRAVLVSTGRLFYGAWRSPVARLLWEQEVPGSNPGAPMSGTESPDVVYDGAGLRVFSPLRFLDHAELGSGSRPALMTSLSIARPRSFAYLRRT